MSSLWTPGGERPVNPQSQPGGGPAGGPQNRPPQQGRTPAGFGAQEYAEPTQEEMQQQMEELRQQLSETPASMVVANHCFGLFELAALHLSVQPPQLGEAQLAIDALGALVENLEGRLGEPEQQLREGLNQLRMAFVQIRQGNQPGDPNA
jgi:hypothetical protein